MSVSGHVDDKSVLQYNYVINNGPTATFMPAQQTYPLVGNPQVLMPDIMNGFFVQPNGEVIPSNGVVYPTMKYQPIKPLVLQDNVNGTVQSAACYTKDTELCRPDAAKFTITKDETGRLKCPYCNYQCMNMTRMKGHCKVHIGQGCKCTYCGKSFNEPSKLRYHIKAKHDNTSLYRCEFCSKEFRSKTGLKFHEKIHKRSFKFWCDACSEGFLSVQNFEEHANQHKDMNHFLCHMCHKEFSNLQPFIIHRRYCNDTGSLTQFKCDMCVSVFCSAEELDDHVSTVHMELSTFSCACGQGFNTCDELDEHCKDCDKALQYTNTKNVGGQTEVDGLSDIEIVSVESLRKTPNKDGVVELDENSSDSIQITNIVSGEKYVCDINGESKEKPFVAISPGNFSCTKCSFTSTNFGNMKKHMERHLEKKFKCPRCPQMFAEQSQVKAHESQRHYNHTRYKCDKCSRTFSSKGGITYHQQTKHNNAYKYKCETCDKGFNTWQHYLGHKNTHTGSRPFVCEKCNIGFSYPSVLTSHKKVCKGKIDGMDMNQLDLYPCKVCSQKFALPSALQEHIKEEHQDIMTTKYVCNCGDQFELKALYDLHKTTCTKTDKSSAVILQAMTQEDFNADSNLPPLQSMSVCSQPVFPS